MATHNDSPKKFPFLFISILLHAVLIYFIVYKALDYALPEGSVTSYEMNFQDGNSNANQTEVSVLEKKAVPLPVQPKPEAIKEIAKIPAPQVGKPAPPKKIVTGDMPVKNDPESTEEESPKEALSQAQDDSLKKQEEALTPVPTEEPQPSEASATETTESQEPQQDIPLAPAVEPPQESFANQESQPGGMGGDSALPAKAGSPGGVQSDAILTPYGTNRPITYPMMARMRKLEGTAVAHYTVDAQGNVTDVKIVKSSGASSLDDQVVSTIKGWKFKPMGREGVYERPVQFSLKGAAQEAPSRLRRGN